MVPVLGEKTPPLVRVPALASVRLAVVTTVPPLLKVIPSVAPKLLAAPICTVPPEMAVPPVKVLAPERIKVPAPAFCSWPTPAMMPP